MKSGVRNKESIRLTCSRWTNGKLTIFLVVILAATLLLTTSGCAAIQKTRREPEIPIELLLEKQSEILGPEWTYTGGYLWTDSDATSALWTAWMDFRRVKNEHFGQEIHVFSDSSEAKILRWPSPASANVEEGNTPKSWNYKPSHADWFLLDCEPVQSPDFCHYLVRYKEYIIYLNSPITEYMTLDDLRKVVRVTDDTMGEYLNNSGLVAGPRGIPDQGELELPID